MLDAPNLQMARQLCGVGDGGGRPLVRSIAGVPQRLALAAASMGSLQPPSPWISGCRHRLEAGRWWRRMGTGRGVAAEDGDEERQSAAAEDANEDRQGAAAGGANEERPCAVAADGERDWGREVC